MKKGKSIGLALTALVSLAGRVGGSDVNLLELLEPEGVVSGQVDLSFQDIYLGENNLVGESDLDFYVSAMNFYDLSMSGVGLKKNQDVLLLSDWDKKRIYEDNVAPLGEVYPCCTEVYNGSQSVPEPAAVGLLGLGGLMVLLRRRRQRG